MENTKKYSSISEGLREVANAMHAQGVTHLKVLAEDGEGRLELELHVPVPRTLSPMLTERAEAKLVDHDEDGNEEPQWKKDARAIDDALELG
jgi:hypothetical protein